MDASWVSLVPPLVVISFIFFTQKLNISLALGIFSAALIAAHGNIFTALGLCVEKMVKHFSEIDNIYLYLLLIVISSLVVLLTVSGSAAGCARIIGRRIKTKRGAETASIFLAFLLSIDDYLSILTVGFVMSPIMDRVSVARTKLAYIVHALAGPLVIIMPISTWAAAVLAQLDNAGVNSGPTSKIMADSFFVYLHTIPFVFYSLINIIAVWFVVRYRISFGLLGFDERCVVKTTPKLISSDEKNQHSIIELIVPIALLVGGVFVGMLYAGGFYLLGGSHSFVDAFRNNDKTFVVLFTSGCVTFAASLCISFYKKIVMLHQVPGIVYEGFMVIKSSIMMVVLASILGSFLRLDLQTGTYVAHMLIGVAPLCFIPLLFFIVSLMITLTTGSAWGTFSLLIPITTQMLITFLRVDTPVELDQIRILFPTLGAVLSGAACGNHISPFAETTIMTATSTGTQPLEHARTQFAYTVPVIVGTCVAFAIMGIMYNSSLYSGFCLSMGVGALVSIFLLIAGNVFLK